MTASRRRAAPPAPVEPAPPPARGTLFVVATPIGNLEDITHRALRVLREVALVAAEDTRRSGNLLRHYEIPTPLVSLHEHNEHARVTRILRELSLGRSVALVSDAGTPGISDPGAVLVREARAQGFRIEAVPGPSAVIAAVSIAGIDADGFTFMGFPPATGALRQKWLAQLAEPSPYLRVFFEAPHRVRNLLRELLNILGEQQIILAKELTKVYEDAFVGTAAEIDARLPDTRGEFVVLIPPAALRPPAASEVSDDEVARVFGQTTDAGAGSRREAIKQTGERLGLPPKAVFAALERVKKP
jgi:16S rRNA (cytidine1402-2'-O)-methyltransferase